MHNEHKLHSGLMANPTASRVGGAKSADLSLLHPKHTLTRVFHCDVLELAPCSFAEHHLQSWARHTRAHTHTHTHTHTHSTAQGSFSTQQVQHASWIMTHDCHSNHIKQKQKDLLVKPMCFCLPGVSNDALPKQHFPKAPMQDGPEKLDCNSSCQLRLKSLNGSRHGQQWTAHLMDEPSIWPLLSLPAPRDSMRGPTVHDESHLGSKHADNVCISSSICYANVHALYAVRLPDNSCSLLCISEPVYITRGGTRVIYQLRPDISQLCMLLAYDACDGQAISLTSTMFSCVSSHL